jgi:endonuclease/exonuclease/phosphatase family metal-dependent hydrolase
MKKAFLILMVSLSSICSILAQKNYGTALPSDYQNPLKDTLSIVTWNVEHFIDAFDNPYIKNGREDESKAEDVKKRVKDFASIIRKLDADVIVLQEFESQPFLERIAKEELEDMNYLFFASAPSPDWYMNVVVMSRVPLGVVYGYGSVYTPVKGSLDKEGRPETQKNINTRMVSVEVIAKPDYSFIVHGLHLKAGRNERDEATRIGQINLLLGQCVRFQKEDKKTKQVVIGDLNSIPGSAEITQLLNGKEKVKFINPFASKPVFSHPSDNPERQLDHILPNIQMAKDMISAEVFQDALLKEISDHLPIKMLLLMK